METKVLLPAYEMTTAQCVMECSGYLRTIANQEFEGEDWQTAPKLRRQNLLTDFLCNLELSGKEFAELCGLIGFQLSKTTTAKLAKFTVMAYDWQSKTNGEAAADVLAALDKCEGVTLIEERGYRPHARTYDCLRFHIAAFWRCLVNELRSLCLGIGLVVRPKEIPATPAETPRISKETAETVNVSAGGENAAEKKEMPQILNCARHTIAGLKEIPNISQLAKAGIIINGVAWHTEYLDQAHNILARVDNLGWHEDGKGFGGYQGSGVFGKTAILESWDSAVVAMIDALTDYLRTKGVEPPQSPETPQMGECTAEQPEPRETAEIAITSITQLNVLKYKLQHPKLKEWAVKYGLLDLVRNMYCAPELSLGGLWIDNKFRQSLCENDKSIIAAVRKLIADAEKAA